MRVMNMKKAISKTNLLLAASNSGVLLLTPAAFAAVPGITGPTFNLIANAEYLTQPDGASVYSWGYGCNGAPSGYVPSAISGGFCSHMQVPGPTLIVTQGRQCHGQSDQQSACGREHLYPVPRLQCDVFRSRCAGPFNAGGGAWRNRHLHVHRNHSRHARLLQRHAGRPAGGNGPLWGNHCPALDHSRRVHLRNSHLQPRRPRGAWREHSGWRPLRTTIPVPATTASICSSFPKWIPRIHREAQQQSLKTCTGCMTVATEPYVPAYFMINGRSMPDDMDPNYAPQYPHQPYNGNPHMHPGELVLLRIIGQGRWQHPFHEHGNHVRILARDGNLILSSTNPTDPNLAGPLLFTTTTTPGRRLTESTTGLAKV